MYIFFSSPRRPYTLHLIKSRVCRVGQLGGNRRGEAPQLDGQLKSCLIWSRRGMSSMPPLRWSEASQVPVRGENSVTKLSTSSGTRKAMDRGRKLEGNDVNSYSRHFLSSSPWPRSPLQLRLSSWLCLTRFKSSRPESAVITDQSDQIVGVASSCSCRPRDATRAVELQNTHTLDGHRWKCQNAPLRRLACSKAWLLGIIARPAERNNRVSLTNARWVSNRGRFSGAWESTNTHTTSFAPFTNRLAKRLISLAAEVSPIMAENTLPGVSTRFTGRPEPQARTLRTAARPSV
ncbi:hypothetical protein G7K_0795-t1 [Saitoella complicata NRRL Y-17804]|uniref:Uncharacterized protein n=1 Tax=Saitoella complicata (strain BCRC 22490 / CBS 7301 / JCM 7358 / NBRC 10748 / NRRL Y-17804) TaxID=698492 RepID=A0A0E9NAX9_SAICN|nr:hypothetical protein G7K_0795-t1 [Saitoella complicata NRRL Y-17804]